MFARGNDSGAAEQEEGTPFKVRCLKQLWRLQRYRYVQRWRLNRWEHLYGIALFELSQKKQSASVAEEKRKQLTKKNLLTRLNKELDRTREEIAES
jgi:hypothetical protein